MKTKLNLTIDSDIIPRVKEFAKKKNMSVSQLVEDLLKNTTKNEIESFSSKWTGKFNVTDSREERAKKLRSRYQL